MGSGQIVRADREASPIVQPTFPKDSLQECERGPNRVAAVKKRPHKPENRTFFPRTAFSRFSRSQTLLRNGLSRNSVSQQSSAIRGAKRSFADGVPKQSLETRRTRKR